MAGKNKSKLAKSLIESNPHLKDSVETIENAQKILERMRSVGVINRGYDLQVPFGGKVIRKPSRDRSINALKKRQVA